MSIWAWLRALFQSWFRPEASRYQVEQDPLVSLDNNLTKLEQSRADIRRSPVEVNAARLRLEKQRCQLQSKIDRYDEQAQATLMANEDDLAWEALQRKQAAVARGSELDHDLISLEGQLTGLKQSRANLERKITLFRAKKESLKTPHTSSEAQLRAQEALAGVLEELTRGEQHHRADRAAHSGDAGPGRGD